MRDALAMPSASYDLICMFDAFHHLTEPDAMLEAMRAASRAGGSILPAETGVSGDPTADATDATAVIVYGSDRLYCYQESKVAGRQGLGATWPGRGLDQLLARHGFVELGRVDSRSGHVVLSATPTAGAGGSA